MNKITYQIWQNIFSSDDCFSGIFYAKNKKYELRRDRKIHSPFIIKNKPLVQRQRANIVDIATTQNVSIEYELASLRERIFAYIIDVLIVYGVYYGIVVLVVMTVGWGRLMSGFASMVILSLLPILLLIGYHLFSEVFVYGQSLGKKILGLRVVRLDGKEPTFSDYLLRAVFQLIDTIFTMGVVAALMVSSSVRHQRFGDMAANTTVIRLKMQRQFKLQEIIEIESREQYEPSYPQVRDLSETDMLTIKDALIRHRTYHNVAHAEALNKLVAHLLHQLNIKEQPQNKITFLQTLIRDYIVLTR